MTTSRQSRLPRPNSKREIVAIGLVLVGGAAVALAVLSTKTGSASSGGAAVSYSAKSGERLGATYYEATLAEGTAPSSLPVGGVLHLETSTQKLYAKPGNRFRVEGESRTVELPAGTYHVYAKYEGTALKFAKLRRCLPSSDFKAMFCPTGNTVSVAAGVARQEITEALTTSYTGPRGLRDRAKVGVFADSEKGKLWRQEGASKVSTLRLYAAKR